MIGIYALTQIKRTNGNVEKGCVIKDSLDGVLQSYHAYLGAYAYGHDANTDYVCCEVIDEDCNRLEWAVWHAPAQEAEA